MPKVKISLPQFPDGTEISVKGLGLLVNNKEVDISDEAVQSYETYTGNKFSDLLREKQFDSSDIQTNTASQQLQLNVNKEGGENTNE